MFGRPPLAPPQRRGWVTRLTPAKKATALLKDYLVSRVGCVNKGESTICRRMLRHLGEVQADGNVCGVELAIINGATKGSVNIFFVMPGLGNVHWLPVMVTEANDRLAQIMRELSPILVVPMEPDKRKEPGIFDEPRRGMGAKLETFIVEGIHV